jgi:hypothetical protein
MVNPDFRDLFAALNGAGARYLVVGGYAVAFHAEPRYTKDLDVWVEPSADNAVRVFAALNEFGAPLGDLSAEDLARPGLIFQIGVPPNRIDIITSIDGVGFTEAWEGRARMNYGGWPIAVIGREALLKNKRATGRPQDLIDVLLIERHSP